MLFFHRKTKKKLWLLGGIDHNNLGDHCIQGAMSEFLNDIIHNAHIQEIPIKEYYDRKEQLQKDIQKNDILIFCGGGNLGNLWPRLENLRRDAFQTWPANPKIVFPQSVYFSHDEEGRADIEKSRKIYAGDQCVLALRDPVSYDLARQYFDCSMFLTPDIVMYMKVKRKTEKRNGVLLLLRSDKEAKLGADDKEKIRSLAAEYDADVQSSDTVLKHGVKSDQRQGELDQLIQMISSRKLVITDRLHGMVLSAITGTPCIVFSNGYHKIDAFMQWMEDLPYIRHVNDVEELAEILKTIDTDKEYVYPLKEKRQLFGEFREAVKTILDR
ncbi:MAG: polysaccharide pyruvyl transferase family protein [Solobacterium sp.]|nr:polysaccharide pyruvyl transferase family protein [Solobacterium sp.]